MKKILIVVDMQEDFIYGSLGNDDCRNAVQGCVDLCESEEFDKIFFTKDTHHQNYLETLEGRMLPVEHCIKDSDSDPGWCIINELFKFAHDDDTVEKPTFGSVPTQPRNLVSVIQAWINENTVRMADYVEPVELHFCGVCTSICILSNMTILRAWFPNTRIVLHKNATGDVTEEMKQAAFVCAKAIQCEVVD